MRAWIAIAVVAAASSAAAVETSATPGKARAKDGDARKADDPGAQQPRPKKTFRADGRLVLVPIHGTIDLGLAPFVERVVEHLKEGDTLILDVDTFGGRVDAAVRIRDALLGTPARVVAFVNRRAISAGALISLAADVIAMTPGGTIGAATPVQMGAPQEGMKPVEEKVVSYMRKEMKATAEAKGRRGDIAEAMVDSDVEIAGVNLKGKVLTLTTDEARKHGIADHDVGDLAALLERIGLPGRTPEKPAITWAERVARFLTDPTVSSLLMAIGMLGILIELYSGGHGIGLVAGLVCLGLFFFGHHVVNLAGWEEIGLFLIGATLLAVEIFVLPGFGLPGVVGTALMILALIMAMGEIPKMPFDVYWSLGHVWSALARVMGAVIVTVVLGLITARYLPRTPMGRRVFLSEASASGASLPQDAVAVAVGSAGVTATDLRPAGKALIDGRRMDVVSDGGFVDKDAAVRVVAVEGSRIVVRPV